jgi:hypothetical protein
MAELYGWVDEIQDYPQIPESAGRILYALLHEVRMPGAPWTRNLPVDWPAMEWVGYAFIRDALDGDRRIADVAVGPERYAPEPPTIRWSPDAWDVLYPPIRSPWQPANLLVPIRRGKNRG